MKYSIVIVLLAICLAHAEQSEKSEQKQEAEALVAEERELEQRAVDTSMMMMDMPEGFNHSSCIFKPEENILLCKNSVDTIECPAVCETTLLGPSFNKSHRYNVFGIGLFPEKIETGVSARWPLYPRKLDNSSYIKNKIVGENSKVFELVLACSEKVSDFVGVRITDCKCWERMVKIFEVASKVPHMARLETEPTVVEEIPLIGEILVLDKAVQKRWLWGYGWGGLRGFGWGGLGYGGLGYGGLYGGYPYLGWGK